MMLVVAESQQASTLGGLSAGTRRRRMGVPPVEFTIGDITREATDAIVNPVGPGLVDLAIRRAAGAELVDAFHLARAALSGGRLARGQAVVTPGFGLPAGHVIHCRPPIYADDPEQARKDLAVCHREALRLARVHGLTSVSLPAIGTGIYRYPLAEAARIAVDTVTAELRAHATPMLVRFVLWSPAALAAYASALDR
ncbi:MAG: macro domain-containing protein [Myxococcales bacterium]